MTGPACERERERVDAGSFSSGIPTQPRGFGNAYGNGYGSGYGQGAGAGLERPHSVPQSIRSAPRSSYRALAAETPRALPGVGAGADIDVDDAGLGAAGSSTGARHSSPAPERKLLILDLNGTLVFRGSRSSATRSSHPTPRPYLGAFLRYCLGRDGEGRGVEEERGEERREREEVCADEETNHAPRPHGTHFRPQSRSHWPRNKHQDETASQQQRHDGDGDEQRYEVLVWSSAQPQNVDKMVKAIFKPEQMNRLIRVWARDTLVPKRLFGESYVPPFSLLSRRARRVLCAESREGRLTSDI